jgi:hypothetical protein
MRIGELNELARIAGMPPEAFQTKNHQFWQQFSSKFVFYPHELSQNHVQNWGRSKLIRFCSDSKQTKKRAKNHFKISPQNQ